VGHGAIVFAIARWTVALRMKLETDCPESFAAFSIFALTSEATLRSRRSLLPVSLAFAGFLALPEFRASLLLATALVLLGDLVWRVKPADDCRFAASDHA